MNNGHYYCIVKTKDNLWIECNDDKIKPLDSPVSYRLISLAR